MNLHERLSTLIAARLVVSTLLLGSATLVQISSPGAFPVDSFFLLIALTYGLSIVYLTTLRFTPTYPWLVDVQFAADAILVTAFIHGTGGITSYFSSLYLLPIIAAATIRSRRGALQVAALNGMLYLGLVAAQYNVGAVPGGAEIFAFVELPSVRFAQYTVAINLFGFLGVALLSGSLAERLRSAGEKLEHASNQIQDLRAFNDYVVESLVSGLVTADDNFKVLTFNRSAATITGVAASDAIGRDIRDIFQLPAHERAKLGTLGETRSVRMELEYRAPQGRSIEIGLTATTLAFPSEDVRLEPDTLDDIVRSVRLQPDSGIGYLLTFQDVTEVRRLERDARLQQRLAAVGEMAAGIAHEIRNPLASMSGSIQVLRQELPLSEEQGQLMDIVLRESERLNETIRVFLAYARPQRFAVARLDVRKVVQDTALLLRTSPYLTGDHLIETDLSAEPVWYVADESQLREVLWNLATNGLRAMPRGGRLRLSARVEGATLVLTVEDHGCGIPADDVDAIFEPFRSSFANGTGLGLAVVHRIVTDHGGTIDVSSKVGAGTTMRVSLPIRGRVTDAETAGAFDAEPQRAAV
jgi:two-component system, NtrC family, sensor histidine kinase PilS